MPTDQAINPLLQSLLVPSILIFFIFYFVVMKPEKDKQKQRKNILNNLKKNDEVVTLAGIHGTIVNVKESTVIIRVDENVKIEFEKEAVSAVNNTKL